MKIIFSFDLDRMRYKELAEINNYVHRAAAPESLGKIYGNVYSKLIDIPGIDKYMQRETTEISEYHAKRNIQLQKHFQEYLFKLLKKKPDRLEDINFMNYWEPNGSGNTIFGISVQYNDDADGIEEIRITDDNVLDYFNLSRVFNQDKTIGYGEAEASIYSMLQDDYYHQRNIFPGVERYKELDNVEETGSCRNFTLQVTEDCNLRCSYCLPAGTAITMADLTERLIEDIKTGDIVLGYSEDPDDNGTRMFKPTKVTKLFKREARCVVVLGVDEFDNPRAIRATYEHPFLTKRGWVAAGALKKTDIVYACDTSLDFLSTTDTEELINLYKTKVSRMEVRDIKITTPIMDKTETVYNFETDTHTYIADHIMVHNCYQINKCASIMSLETAKSSIDDLLKGEFDYLSPGFSKSVILEFIGGDPLLEIDLIGEVYEYFLQEAYRLNHPWFYHHRLSMCTNAMLYFSENTKRFFDKFARQVSFNVSIDGNKSLHDSCRVQPTGEGSYDIGIAAVHHSAEVYRMDLSSKMTLAPSNIPMIAESVKNLCFDNNYPGINLNCVFEDVWSKEDATVLFHQLIKVADMVYEHNRPDLFFSIYRNLPLLRGENPAEMLTSFCGGNGRMLSLSPDGIYYPCIRYMPSSLGDDMNPIVIGNIKDKMINDAPALYQFEMITGMSQVSDVCISCPFKNFCGACIGLCYQLHGTANEKTRTLCDMAKAQYLAAVYYWSKIKTLVPEFKLQLDEEIIPYYHFRDIITHEEYDQVVSVWKQALLETDQ